jgi:dihydroorotase (multifunctional complex type)
VVDLAIVNGSVAVPFQRDSGWSFERATLAIDRGHIHAILAPDSSVEADEVIDAAGMLVLPGAIDIHFHCRAPAFPERGTFASETRAAAAGGVTTVFEMPISQPGVATAEIWESRRRLAEREAFVNVGLYGSPGLLDAAEIQGMVDAGAIGFKFFLTDAPEGREDEFEGLVAEDLAAVAQALELIKPSGLRCVFHAEDQSLLDHYMARAEGMPGPDFRRQNRSRPPVVEATAVAALVTLANELDAPIHIAHVTSEAAVGVLRYARTLQAPVTAETCPHYLLFTDDVLEEVGPYGKINPPLRSLQDQRALWQAVADDIIDVVATDHAPFTAEEKEAAWDDILEAPPGHPGVEHLVPLMMTQAYSGRLSLGKAVDLITSKPAQLFNLYPQKGSLWPGADADVIIYDPRDTRTIDRTEGLSHASACNRLYDGMQVRGDVHATIVGGKIIYRGGDIVGDAGDGRIARPSRSPTLEFGRRTHGDEGRLGGT